MISRTGWTAVQGFEINLIGYDRGEELWNAVLEAGEEFNIRPVAPVEARRIEAGIYNYNSDMDLSTNPFEVSGLERLVEEQPQDYIGKAALEEIRRKGVSRKLVGVEIGGQETGKSCGNLGPADYRPLIRRFRAPRPLLRRRSWPKVAGADISPTA